MAVAKTFRMPPLVFGQGASETLGEEAKRIGAGKVFIVTDEVLHRLGVLDKILASLSAEKVKYDIFDKLPTEPTVDMVNEGFSLFKKSGANIIVAAGGGTPIDTAKAIGVLVTNEGTIPELWKPSQIKKPGVPAIAIPTTAGTGAEGTIWAVITDSKTDIKIIPSITASIPRGDKPEFINRSVTIF